LIHGAAHSAAAPLAFLPHRHDEIAPAMSVLRSIPASMAGAAVASVDHRLDQIAADCGARILLAVESGSRAWGFPSPDSDYDCRFIYTRSPDDYLTPWVPRDVIETPIEGELDVNGWDLAKALKLLVKGNAVVVEWLTSPIVYRGDQRFKNELLAFAGFCLDRQMVARHYLHLGLRQRRLHFTDQADVALKKVFYALRPAAVLRWLRLNPEAAIAPMHFPTLMAQCAPPREVSDIVDGLLARKAVTRELGTSTLPTPIGRFIDQEFSAAGNAFDAAPTPPTVQTREAATTLFRTWAKFPIDRQN
jgi:predicted nucleotidyltransferase